MVSLYVNILSYEMIHLPEADISNRYYCVNIGITSSTVIIEVYRDDLLEKITLKKYDNDWLFVDRFGSVIPEDRIHQIPYHIDDIINYIIDQPWYIRLYRYLKRMVTYY